MSMFVERERAFEAKFAHDEDQRLLTLARANWLLALWAAEALGLAADQAEAYAGDVTRHALGQPDDRAVLLRIRQDLRSAGLQVGDVELERAYAERLATSRHQLRLEDLTTPESHPAA